MGGIEWGILKWKFPEIVAREGKPRETTQGCDVRQPKGCAGATVCFRPHNCAHQIRSLTVTDDC